MNVTIGNSIDEKEIMALIEQGAIDTESESDELVKDGKVYRRAAVALQSNADQKALAGRVLNAIAQKLKNTKEKNGMTKEELLAAIKAAIANSTLTLEEISQALGMENKLRNATDEQRAKLQAAIAEALELPPETPVEELLKAAEAAFKEAEEAAESVVEAEANKLAENRKLKNADGTEVDNPVYIYARNSLKGKRGKQLNEAVEALKKDPVMMSLRSKQADTRTTITPPGLKPQQNQNIREV
jgi:lambda repressor-like predicted transcriptional regulator